MNHNQRQQYVPPASQPAYGGSWNPPTTHPPPSYQPPVYTGYYQQHQPYGRPPVVPATPNTYPPPPQQVQQPRLTMSVTTAPPTEQTSELYETCVYVGLEDAPQEFRLAFKVIGEKGQNLEYLSRTTGAKVILRGRGTGLNNSKPLHIYVGHSTLEGKEEAESLANNLVRAVKEEYTDWRKSRNLDVKSPLTPTATLVNRSLDSKMPLKLDNEKRRLTITRGPVGREEGRIEDRRVVQIQRPDSAINRLGPAVPFPNSQTAYREKQVAPDPHLHERTGPQRQSPPRRLDDSRPREHSLRDGQDRRRSPSPARRYPDAERHRSRSPLGAHSSQRHQFPEREDRLRSPVREDRHRDMYTRDRNPDLSKSYRSDEPREHRSNEVWPREKKSFDDLPREDRYKDEHHDYHYRDERFDDGHRDRRRNDRFADHREEPFHRDERRDDFRAGGREDRYTEDRYDHRARDEGRDDDHWDMYREDRFDRDRFERKEDRISDGRRDDRFKEGDRYGDFYEQEEDYGDHRNEFNRDRERSRREEPMADQFGKAYEQSKKLHQKAKKKGNMGIVDRGQRYFIPGMRGKPLQDALEKRDFSRLVPIFVVKKIQAPQTSTVWVVGDMFTYLACQSAADHPLGPNLGLRSTMVFWFAFPKITIESTADCVEEKMVRNLPPNAIVLHVGAEELARYIGKDKVLEKNMRKMVSEVRRTLPKAHISWSNILPWKKYPSKEPNRKIEEVRNKMNDIAKDLMKEFKGSTLFHDHDFQKERKDGVDVYQPNGFYPSEEGAKCMVLNFETIIKDLVSEPA